MSVHIQTVWWDDITDIKFEKPYRDNQSWTINQDFYNPEGRDGIQYLSQRRNSRYQCRLSVC